MQQKKRISKRGTLALSQIFILIIGIIAIAYAIGSEIKLINAKIIEVDNLQGYSTFKIIKIDETTKKYTIEIPDAPVTAPTSSTYSPTHGYAGQGASEIGMYSVEKGQFLFRDDKGALQVSKTNPNLAACSGTEAKSCLVKGSGTGGASSGLSYSVTGVAQGFLWAVTVYYAVKMFGGFLGLKEGKLEATATAAAYGVFAYKATASVFGKGGILQVKKGEFFGNLGGGAGYGSAVVGLIVAAYMYYQTYKKETQEIISFTCNPWDAPTGGSKCEECNRQGILPCSEYQCRSLGQSCQLLNPGTSQEKCTWVNRKDVKPPVIQPWDDALLANYTYTPDNTISPPDRGVIIQYTPSTTKCVQAFTPFTFGINTDEPAKCKLDYIKRQNFSDMKYWFGGSALFDYNHTQLISLPGPSAFKAENLTLENGGNFELFTRCQDANGNANTANFVFKYCVESGPDTQPPVIMATSLINGMPIAYNQSTLYLETYTNEPASCKWSHTDQSYDKMETAMTCVSSIFEMNAQMLYKCYTNLTGINNNIENNFYFRCKDSSENINTQSHNFKIQGTQPLVITSVAPNSTIKGATQSINVTLTAETFAGYQEGKSTCYYSATGATDSYIAFFNTDSHEHSQQLYFPSGTYTYSIKCIDLGGNTDQKNITFKVETDSSSPMIIRAYKEETYLKLTTDEEAECTYNIADSEGCNFLFDDGIKMQTTDDINHFSDWSTNTNLYIKCKDQYNNQPLPNECSIIVRPFETSGE